MRLAPRSLLGRNALLLLVLFLFGLACGGLALRQWVQKPRITELAELVAREIRLAQANLELVPDQQRASLRPWLNSRGGVMVLPRSAGSLPRNLPPPGEAARQFIGDLRWRLPDLEEVHWAPLDQGTVWARMRLGKEQYWFIESGVYLESAISGTSIAVLVLAGLLSVSGAVLIQRRVNRPLARLVEAARTFALGRTIAPLDESGPEELTVVSRTFNQMISNLKKADAERAILLAGVSHDLRTPIAKMRLAIEMLSGQSDASLVESMLRSAAEMESVTDQFLYYARQESGHELIETDLNALVLESVERHHSDARPITTNLRLGFPVALHPASMRRALDNLIENALRYSDREVAVETDYGDGVVRVSVLDRGPGISADEAQTLKLPFARGSASVGTPGTGLGLAIVERIASAHQGKLELRARQGGGTEARLELNARGRRQRTASGPDS